MIARRYAIANAAIEFGKKAQDLQLIPNFPWITSREEL